MVSSLYTLNSCKNKAPQPEPISAENLPWVVDRFDDIKVLRYEVPGFEQLPLEQKKLVYYLAEAAKCGRDILFDQNFKYNLTIRRALEQIYTKYDGERRYGLPMVFTTTTLTTNSSRSSHAHGLSR